MMPTPRATDKSVFAVIYLIAALMLIWSSGRFVNYTLDASFYRECLLKWEISLVALRHQKIDWPVFNSNNFMAYMQALVQQMKAQGIALPESNSDYAFIYRLNKFGEKPQQIFVLCLSEKIKIFGLPESTLLRLDRFIDGRVNLKAGVFTSQPSVDQITFIGHWKI